MNTLSTVVRPLRVVVVEDDEQVRTGLVQSIESVFGHQVIGQAGTGQEMVQIVLSMDPDVVLFDIHLPGLDGFDALQQIWGKKPVAAVAITGDRDHELVRQAMESPVQAFLVKPFEPHQLGPALTLARARFLELTQLGDEKQRLERTLEGRKVIERAKGVLMRRHRWTEPDAFRRLQRAAMNRRMSMADLARQIIEGKDLEL